MNTKLVISLSCFLATGACLAQAPVVEAQNTVSAQTSSLRTPAQTSNAEIGGMSVVLEQRLASLERIVGSRTESQQRLQAQVNQLQRDIDEMRGSIELHTHQLEKLLERQRDLFLEIDKGFNSTQQSTSELGDNIARSTQPSASVASRATSPLDAVNSAGEQESYQNAVNLILKDRDYVKAVPAFQAFLAQFPNSDSTPNAHYWLGQLLYNQQNYSEAKVQFTQVANRFTNSPKRSDSLLKLGLIEKSTGNVQEANSFFQQVINEYPDSTPARLASQQLAN
ncbi:tetratricopeptide TPR_2 [Glaciecola punicea ACAM 611]|jgi:tol-pal system protein YbgF|uniref:Cell division coordinator CpoB n=1 Tax=Glaciecola punicea ACAM 611 TaxID=1121923 RepID=H5TBL6_9ALTE|nr:tol-pal system protein YbgF [Glaciecola punicea]GAB55693.1 tetratricopeptide TPR_2 [Glaciecola punicea ACAM 611]